MAAKITRKIATTTSTSKPTTKSNNEKTAVKTDAYARFKVGNFEIDTWLANHCKPDLVTGKLVHNKRFNSELSLTENANSWQSQISCTFPIDSSYLLRLNPFYIKEEKQWGFYVKIEKCLKVSHLKPLHTYAPSIPASVTVSNPPTTAAAINDYRPAFEWLDANCIAKNDTYILKEGNLLEQVTKTLPSDDPIWRLQLVPKGTSVTVELHLKITSDHWLKRYSHNGIYTGEISTGLEKAEIAKAIEKSANLNLMPGHKITCTPNGNKEFLVFKG